jgi:hypothetical protein
MPTRRQQQFRRPACVITHSLSIYQKCLTISYNMYNVARDGFVNSFKQVTLILATIIIFCGGMREASDSASSSFLLSLSTPGPLLHTCRWASSNALQLTLHCELRRLAIDGYYFERRQQHDAIDFELGVSRSSYQGE